MASSVPEDRYLRIGNLKIRYWALGDHGEAVILLHGLGASAEIWLHNIHGIAQNHRVYAPDLAGFGRSDQPGLSFSPLDYSQMLNGFIQSLDLKLVSIVGQSFGGGIALHYALQFPQKVEKLVLIDSAGLGRDLSWTLRLMSLPLLGGLLCSSSHKGVEKSLKFVVCNPDVVTEYFVELYHRYSRRPGFRRFHDRLIRRLIDLRGVRQEVLLPILNGLSHITQPVLLIWGEKDRVIPVRHGLAAQKKIRNAKLHIMADTGHIPFFERPEEFNRLVLEFLSA